MKKLLIAAALLCTFSVQAQNTQDMKKKSPQERADMRSKMMEKKLKLNESQATQIRKINTDAAVQMEAQLSQNQKNRAQLKALHENQEAQYKQVLTSEQMASYDKMKDERRARMAENGNRRMKKNRTMDNNRPELQQAPAQSR